MKRRPVADTEPVIDKALLAQAKRAVEPDRLKRIEKCSVCGSDCTPSMAPNAEEGLCWVCRRLKISAWRDSDPQTLQE